MSGINANGENLSFEVSKDAIEPPFLLLSGFQKYEPIEPSIWKDEHRMKEEIIAWAKAVAAIAAVHFSQECHKNDN